jgi:protein yorkie
MPRTQYAESLERERMNLKHRQEEIRRNGQIMKLFSAGNGGVLADARLPPISTTGMDPFLGGSTGVLNNINSDCHSRQESGDSGLGLGTNYSLPHTPEDFLSHIEDVVNESEESNNNSINRNNNDLGLDSLGHVDLGSDNMESDDLVPTLQDSIPDLCNLLDSNRDNLMTWL